MGNRIYERAKEREVMGTQGVYRKGVDCWSHPMSGKLFDNERLDVLRIASGCRSLFSPGPVFRSVPR